MGFLATDARSGKGSHYPRLDGSPVILRAVVAGDVAPVWLYTDAALLHAPPGRPPAVPGQDTAHTVGRHHPIGWLPSMSPRVLQPAGRMVAQTMPANPSGNGQIRRAS